ncbi:hypothetical protein KKB55_00635 [Myxococcota bacterium]|nr:hypothetical protein [Myxococcota bacterium]MBU1896257.1 hypothetical protein [Myxococcota bacterium]
MRLACLLIPSLLLLGCFIEPLSTAEVRLSVTAFAQSAEGECVRDVEGRLQLNACGAWLRLESPEVIELPLSAPQGHTLSLELAPGRYTVTLIGYVGGEAPRLDGAEAVVRLEAGQVEAIPLALRPLPTVEVSTPEETARVEVLDVAARVAFDMAVGAEGLRLPERHFELAAFDAAGAELDRWTINASPP